MCRQTWLQEVIVSATVVAAGLSSALGGAFSDALGRKAALLAADILFAGGAVVMAGAGRVGALITGDHVGVTGEESINRWSVGWAE